MQQCLGIVKELKFQGYNAYLAATEAEAVCAQAQICCRYPQPACTVVLQYPYVPLH